MTHPKREEWMDYLYGEIEPQQQETLSVHLHECAKCRQQVTTWRSAMRNLDGWKLTNGSTGARRALLGPIRWAAAVLMILALGLVIGRFTAASPDMDQLQQRLEMSLTSSLEPAIRQNITDTLNRDWLGILAASRAQLRDDLQTKFRADLNEYAADTFAATYTATNELLANLIQTLDAAQAQERYRILETLDQLEQQRLYDDALLRSDLVHLALQTGEGFQKLMTGKDIKDNQPEVIKNNARVNQDQE